METEYEYDDDYNNRDTLPDCPRCDSNDVDHKGGDWVMNIGSGWQRVDWYTCNECGKTFTESS